MYKRQWQSLQRVLSLQDLWNKKTDHHQCEWSCIEFPNNLQWNSFLRHLDHWKSKKVRIEKCQPNNLTTYLTQITFWTAESDMTDEPSWKKSEKIRWSTRFCARSFFKGKIRSKSIICDTNLLTRVVCDRRRWLEGSRLPPLTSKLILNYIILVMSSLQDWNCISTISSTLSLEI